MKPKIEMTAIIKNKKNMVISIGKNSYVKTHPLMFKLARKLGDFNTRKVFIHAEVDAIIKCTNINQAYRIEVYRYSKNKDRYLCSKPCKICMSAISKTPIKYVRYIDKNLNLVEERIK